MPDAGVFAQYGIGGLTLFCLLFVVVLQHRERQQRTEFNGGGKALVEAMTSIRTALVGMPGEAAGGILGDLKRIQTVGHANASGIQSIILSHENLKRDGAELRTAIDRLTAEVRNLSECIRQWRME